MVGLEQGFAMGISTIVGGLALGSLPSPNSVGSLPRTGIAIIRTNCPEHLKLNRPQFTTPILSHTIYPGPKPPAEFSFKAKALSMAKKEPVSIGPSAPRIKGGGQHHPAGASSRPTPEDGHRLIQAFMDVKQAALREAIIRLVTELSKLNDEP